MTVCVALYVGQGLHYARLLYPSSLGVEYLVAGTLAVKGQVSLYDDRLPGNKVPLPFYVLGLTQVWGPSLRTARWANIGFGLLALLLTASLARRLDGEKAGILAAMFLATQGVVVAYYSWEAFLAFAAFCVVGTLFVLFGGDSTPRRILGTALVGLLFLVRTNLWPAIPFLLGYSLWRARGWLERALLVGVVALPPLIFFAWDPRHLKLLAYVPVVRHLVAPLGYVSLIHVGRDTWSLPASLLELARGVRRHEAWVLATLVVLVFVLWRAANRRPIGALIQNPKANLLALLLIYLVPTQFLVNSWWNWYSAGIYFTQFAPLVPILLGIGWSRLLDEFPAGSTPRRALWGILVVAFVLPLYFVRNPFYPPALGDIASLHPTPPPASAERAGAELRRVVPQNAKVFFYGWNVVYHLSGLPPTYLNQVYSSGMLASVAGEDSVLRKMGLIPVGDMEHWLSADADYAVIEVRWFLPATPVPLRTTVETLLARHFDKVDTVENEYPYHQFEIYRRKSRDR